MGGTRPSCLNWTSFIVLRLRDRICRSRGLFGKCLTPFSSRNCQLISIDKNASHHMKALHVSFHLNGWPFTFHPQTEILASHHKTQSWDWGGKRMLYTDIILVNNYWEMLKLQYLNSFTPSTFTHGTQGLAWKCMSFVWHPGRYKDPSKIVIQMTPRAKDCRHCVWAQP